METQDRNAQVDYTFPSLAEFTEFSRSATVVPVYRTLLADHLTPVSAYQRLAGASTHSFLLESVVGGDRIARYSFVGSNPRAIIKAYGDKVTIETRAPGQRDAAAKLGGAPQGDANIRTFTSADPLRQLEELLGTNTQAKVVGLPAFTGGAVGYAGYDTVRYLEPEKLKTAPPDHRGLPDLLFALYDDLVVFDHVRKTILVIANIHVAGTAPDAAYAQAETRLDAMVRLLERPHEEALRHVNLGVEHRPAYIANLTQKAFEQSVEKAKEYIQAGDIFQVVLSQCLSMKTNAPPLDIYRALRVINPSPFMFYLDAPECILIGSSPEIMCRVQDGVITNRPLAGTRRRGETEEQDKRLEQELLADPKERAEHIMLVDLGRNDVGRAAVPGSVTLSDVMTVERYSHVMHIVSNVNGKLAPDKTAFDALRLALPVGTVSGAPKIRAMQIIDELEPTKRGPYAGAVGYLDYRGNMDTCIALRTMVVMPDGDGHKVYVQSGGGVVADSDPTSEYQESLNKAAGLLKAVALAERDLAAGGGR